MICVDNGQSTNGGPLTATASIIVNIITANDFWPTIHTHSTSYTVSRKYERDERNESTFECIEMLQNQAQNILRA